MKIFNCPDCKDEVRYDDNEVPPKACNNTPVSHRTYLHKSSLVIEMKGDMGSVRIEHSISQDPMGDFESPLGLYWWVMFTPVDGGGPGSVEWVTANLAEAIYHAEHYAHHTEFMRYRTDIKSNFGGHVYACRGCEAHQKQAIEFAQKRAEALGLNKKAEG